MSWREIGEKKFYFRSQWEYEYAKYLEFLKFNQQIESWEFEPETFWFEEIRRGTRSYLPDFRVKRCDGTHYYVEVKGYYDRKSLTKIKRFRKYYPNEELILIDGDWFKKHGKLLPNGKANQKNSSLDK
jgi:predicted nuclease of restriction endonuclease-like RecB superfamily